MLIDIFVIFFVTIASFLLFKKAAGTLELNKLNIISYVYYLFVVQAFLGSILIKLGYDEHYTLNKLIYREASINLATYALWFTLLLLPCIMLIIFRLFKFDSQNEYGHFLEKEIVRDNEMAIFLILITIAVVQLLLLIILLVKTGYVPLLKLITADSSFNFATERIKNKNISVFGNEYIKSVVLSLGIPVIGYITAAYALVTKQKKWIILAGYYFIIALIIKTFDFAKSPLIFHLFIYLLIVLYIKHGKIKNSLIIGFAMIMACLLMGAYKLTGYEGSFLDIYNGILGRTLFTQMGTLCYHFDLFPNIFNYLHGRSLSPSVLKLLGSDPDLHLRSAKLVMEFYGSDKVYENTAGVMNTSFIGEAYANWGWSGVLFSIVWVGIVISVLFILIMRIKKTPITIAMFAMITQYIGNASQGGFVDFVYNFSLIVIVIGCLCLIYMDDIRSCLKKHYILKKQRGDDSKG